MARKCRFSRVVSQQAVLKYIAKYASKAERISEIYHENSSTRVVSESRSYAPTLSAYIKLLQNIC